MQKRRFQTKISGDPARGLKVGLGVLGAAGAGAALMYFLDPQRGRRRRIVARDKLNRMKNKTSGAVGATSRDLRNRAHGFIAETKSLVSRRQVSDEVLAERVRARLGSLVSRASSIQVWSDNGRITLSGGILAAELARLIRGVSSIRGVTGIENLLTVQESFESIPGDSGRARTRAARLRFESLRRPWSTTTRLIVGAFGSLLAIGGAVCRNINSGTVVVLGMVLVSGALSTKRFLRSTGMGGESRGRENGVPQNGARNGEGAPN